MTIPATFWKALRSLMHPIAIGAIVLLLVNDHLLRVNHASWLTGKLGDFSWLIFAPFLCALVLAWVVPRRYEQVIGVLSIGFIGVWFATAKTLPAIYDLTVNLSASTSGGLSSLIRDPSDLLTLPALLISAYIWQRASDAPVRTPSPVWVLVGLAIMGTLASDDTVYLYGVQTVCEDEQGTLYVKGTPATTPYDWMRTLARSQDGGLSWQTIAPDDPLIDSVPIENCATHAPIIYAQNEAIQYTWVYNEAIYRSLDSGVSWSLAYDLPEYDQDVRERRYILRDTGLVFLEKDSEPHNGMVHSLTGNAVFAMGVDGVLVYNVADNRWQWVEVAGYQLESLSDFSRIDDLLFFEWWLALALAMLIYTSARAYIREAKPLTQIALNIGRASWLILVGALLTAFQINDDWTIAIVSFALLFVLALPMSIATFVDMFKNFPAQFVPITYVAIPTALLFLLPYVLWANGTIYAHRTAAVFSVLMTVLCLTAGIPYLSRKLTVIGQPPPSPRISRTPSGNWPPDEDLWEDD